MKLNPFKINHFATKLPLGGEVETASKEQQQVWNTTSHLHLDPNADIKSLNAFGGLIGSFIPVRNDFSFVYLTSENGRKLSSRPTGGGQEEARQVVEGAKHVRFLVCSLALAAMTLCVMSRLILNVSIVEMTKSHNATTGCSQPPIAENYLEINYTYEELTNETTNEQLPLVICEDDEDEHRFDWSLKGQNLLLASFYIGFCPSLLLSGVLAAKYGSKALLLICVGGSGVINLLTPLVAHLSLALLICLRIMLGIVQGGIIPAAYDLFNKWLTSTETSIFVPLIKLSASIGVLLGSLVPGLTASFGYRWPLSFYLTSFICLLWSIAWWLLSTSSPQTNWMVKAPELERIQRKKKAAEQQKPPTQVQVQVVSSSIDEKTTNEQQQQQQPVPWLLIVTNSSVIALTIVKFTYNMGMDFLLLELAVYLKKVHLAPIETISLIGSCGALIQMSLITFVGIAAKELIKRKTFGFSITKWRKVFQGTSNFTMGTIYLLLPLATSRLDLTAILVGLIYTLWIFGTAGESMVPFDLSVKYPATIAGVAQSVSILSGLVVPILCGFVLGQNEADVERWQLLFLFCGCSLYLGGLIFVLVLKAKPFLPEELPTAAGEHDCASDN